MVYVTLKDIAKAAGVSINTVSRALNGKPDVNAQTRQRVMEAANALGYVPNKSALSLKTQKTHIIGVLIEDNANPFWAEVLKGVETIARKNGYHVILANTSRNYEDEIEGIQFLLERRVDGFLIAPNQKKYDDLLELKKLGIPYVVMGRHVEELGVPMVYSDEIKGGYQATVHLIERGCRKVAFVGTNSYNTASSERYEGYKRALVESGLEMDEKLVKRYGIEIEGGYRSAKDLLKSGVEFDGVFAYNDLMAFGVIKALKEVKIEIPQEVKIVGYDDIPYSSMITPSLTTMRIKKQLMGRVAFELFLNPEDRVVLDTELVVREST